jgi:hypothetical protein
VTCTSTNGGSSCGWSTRGSLNTTGSMAGLPAEMESVSFQSSQMEDVSMGIEISGVASLALERIPLLLLRREQSRRGVQTSSARRRKARRAFSRFSAKIHRVPENQGGIPTSSHLDEDPAIPTKVDTTPTTSSPDRHLSIQRQGISRYCPVTTKTTAGGHWRKSATGRSIRRTNTANKPHIRPHIRPAPHGATIQTKSAALYY